MQGDNVQLVVGWRPMLFRKSKGSFTCAGLAVNGEASRMMNSKCHVSPEI